MKKHDIKSLVFGFIIGTIGVTTVFASERIKTVAVSSTTVMLDGSLVSLTNPVVSVTIDDADDSSLYVPLRELFEKLGYTVNWDSEQKTVSLFSAEFEVTENKETATFIFPEPVKTSLKKTGNEEHLIHLMFSIKTYGAIENEIARNEPAIREAVVKTLQSLDYDTIKGATDFPDNLKERLVKEINAVLGKEVVTELFVSEFFIQ